MTSVWGKQTHGSSDEHELTYLTQMLVNSSQVIRMSAIGFGPFEDLLSHLNPSHRCCGSQVDLVCLHTSCGGIEDDSGTTLAISLGSRRDLPL